LAKYSGNSELANAIARRTKARDERVADLVRRARSAGDAQAVDLLTEALSYNPTRADIREDLERRRAAMGRAPAVARGVMEREVRDTLDAYEAAYAKRNIEDFLKVAPFRTRAQIENEFKNFRSIQLSIENATVAIDDNNLGASVTCTINRVLVPSVSAPPIKDRLTWQFRMTKVDGAWQITSATASR
jgi:hypothetical protein